MDEQNHIGWNHLLEGWISKAWVVKQQWHYEKSKAYRSGK
jgi:hypothetical protein